MPQSLVSHSPAGLPVTVVQAGPKEELGMAVDPNSCTPGLKKRAWHKAVARLLKAGMGRCIQQRASAIDARLGHWWEVVPCHLAPQHKHNGSAWLDAAFLASLTETPGFSKGDRQAAREGDVFLP